MLPSRSVDLSHGGEKSYNIAPSHRGFVSVHPFYFPCARGNCHAVIGRAFGNLEADRAPKMLVFTSSAFPPRRAENLSGLMAEPVYDARSLKDRRIFLLKVFGDHEPNPLLKDGPSPKLLSSALTIVPLQCANG